MPRLQEHDRGTCGTERVHQEFPLRFKLLLIVTRMGRDYRPGPQQRIEQVAREGSFPNRLLLTYVEQGISQLVGLVMRASHSFRYKCLMSAGFHQSS